jgi:predicted ATPase
MHVTDRYFIITGGPGSGKRTLIDALRAIGIRHPTDQGGN